VQLIDARHGPTELDHRMVAWLRERGLPFLLVFTKADKLAPARLEQMLAELDRQGTLAEAEYVPFSAVSGQGRADVLAWIGRALRPETVQTAASRPPP